MVKSAILSSLESAARELLKIRNQNKQIITDLQTLSVTERMEVVDNNRLNMANVKGLCREVLLTRGQWN